MSFHGYPVYRINSNEKELLRVGSILEFRRSRRSMNRLGLAKLAQKLFAQGPGDIIIVGNDSSLEREGSRAFTRSPFLPADSKYLDNTG